MTRSDDVIACVDGLGPVVVTEDLILFPLVLLAASFFQSMSEEKYRPLTSRLLVGRPRWKLLFDEIGRTNEQ